MQQHRTDRLGLCVRPQVCDGAWEASGSGTGAKGPFKPRYGRVHILHDVLGWTDVLSIILHHFASGVILPRHSCRLIAIVSAFAGGQWVSGECRVRAVVTAVEQLVWPPLPHTISHAAVFFTRHCHHPHTISHAAAAVFFTHHHHHHHHHHVHWTVLVAPITCGHRPCALDSAPWISMVLVVDILGALRQFKNMFITPLYQQHASHTLASRAYGPQPHMRS